MDTIGLTYGCFVAQNWFAERMEVVNHTKSTVFKRSSAMTPEETRVMCAYMKKLCGRLKLKSNVMCSVLVFFHRFHARHVAGGGGVHYDEYDLATACVFLACKVEENILKLEKILDAAHALRMGGPRQLSENPEQMWKTRERTLICERILLDTISFNVAVEHSHFHANRFSLQIANGDKSEAQALHQIASNILNDSLSTNLCLRHSPALIGAAAVRLAGRVLKDQSSQPRPSLIKLEELEATSKIFGEATSDVLAVEDELISTYEFGTGDGQSGSQSSGQGSSWAAGEANKRTRVMTPPVTDDL